MNSSKCPPLGLAALLGLFGPLAGPRIVRADEVKAHCVVQVVQALEAAEKKPGEVKPAEAKPGAEPGLQIDAKIEALRPYLSKAPFTAWQRFTLLEEKSIDLVAKGSQSFQLPNGKPATLTFLEHLPEGKGKHHRIRVQLQVGDAARPALNTVFVAPEGKVVLQVIQEPQHKDKGLLVLGTRCAEAAGH